MPCLEITMPATDLATRTRLAEALTREFDAATGFGADIFGIRFHEYEPGQTAVGGRVWDGTGTPYLHFLLYCPRIRRAAKQSLAAGLTRAFTTIVGKPDWLPVIHIDEHAYDNVCVAGQLLSDLDAECAALEFYYSLSDRAPKPAATRA